MARKKEFRKHDEEEKPILEKEEKPSDVAEPKPVVQSKEEESSDLAKHPKFDKFKN